MQRLQLTMQRLQLTMQSYKFYLHVREHVNSTD